MTTNHTTEANTMTTAEATTKSEFDKAFDAEIKACEGWPCGLCCKDDTCRRKRNVEGQSCTVYDCTEIWSELRYSFDD